MSLSSFTDQQLHSSISDMQQELQKRRKAKIKSHAHTASEAVKDTSHAVPAAVSSVSRGIGTLANHIRQFGRDYRNG